MADPPAPATPNRHVVALLREELHKLEYGYERNIRLKPPERAIVNKNRALSKSTQERLVYLTERKASMEADLKNLTSERNAVKDKKTQLEIAEHLLSYDEYCRLIQRKIFKMKELRSNNSNMIQLITELSTEVNRRNAILREQTDRIEVQKGQLEKRIHWAQLCLNSVTAENNELRRDIGDSMAYRKILHEMYVKRNNEYTKVKKQVHKKARYGCNLYKALKYGQDRMERKLAKHNRKLEQLKITVNELYQMAANRTEVQRYFNQIRASRNEIVNGRKVEFETPLDKEYYEARVTNKYLRKGHKQLLQENPSCKNLDQLVQMYEELDQDNYELMVDTIKIDGEVTALSTTNGEFVKTVDAYFSTFPGVLPGTIGHDEELTQIQRVLTTTKDDLERRSNTAEIAQHCLDLLLSALHDTFQLMDGDSDPLAQFLGAKKGFTAYSIDVCLQLMEHRLTNLLYEKQYYETWRDLSTDETARPLPELIFGSPPTAGGAFSPKVPTDAVSSRVEAEVTDDVEQKAELLNPTDTRLEAMEEVFRRNQWQQDTERQAYLNQQELVKKRERAKKAKQEQAALKKSKSTVSFASLSGFKASSTKLITQSKLSMTKLSTSKSSTPRPSTSKPSTPRPSTSKLSTPRPSTSKLSTPRPSTSKPSTPRPSTSKPSTPRPSTSKPSTSKP